MLQNFGGLTPQLFDKPFKSMLYSIYNMAEEESYFLRYQKYGYDIDIDNFEYMIFNTEDISYNELLSFKSYIEENIEKNKTVVGILIMKVKSGNVLIAIKPKTVDIVDIVKE